MRRYCDSLPDLPRDCFLYLPTLASKLLHTMQQPEIKDEDVVITFDDDRIYPPDIVQMLIAAAGRHPDKVIATAGWAAERFAGAGRELTAMGEPRQPRADAFLKEGFIDVVIGACGTLYRKAFFDPQWLDYDGFVVSNIDNRYCIHPCPRFSDVLYL